MSFDQKAWDELVGELGSVKCDMVETRYWLEDEILRAIDPKLLLAVDVVIKRCADTEGIKKILVTSLGVKNTAENLSAWLRTAK